MTDESNALDFLCRLGGVPRDPAWTTLHTAMKPLLARIADSESRTFVLVLDHWDEALEFGSGDPALIRRFINSAFTLRGNKGEQFGLVFGTRFPAPEFLIDYAHRSTSGGLRRLSGEIERFTTPATVPDLERSAAVEVVRSVSQGALNEQTVNAIVDDCGGWLQLLIGSSSLAVRTGGWDAETRSAAARSVLRTLLEKSLLPGLQAIWAPQGGSTLDYRQIWFRVIEVIDRQPSRLRTWCLPSSYASPDKPAPILRDDLWDTFDGH